MQLIKFAAFAVVVLALSALISRSDTAHAGWNAPYCENLFTNYPVSDGYMHGGGCVRFGNGGDDFKWAVWADTWTTWSYAQWVSAAGQDRCGADPWTTTAGSSSIGYNVAHHQLFSQSLNPWPNWGYYFDCSEQEGHDYRLLTNHLRWKNSWLSPVEGKADGMDYY